MSGRDPESSLELLLDAMCNTFGGVMFIAISLVVVMSMLSNVSSAPPSPEKLQQELERQQRELAKLRRTAAEKMRAAEIMQNDPRMKQAAELLQIMQRRTKLAAELARMQANQRSLAKLLQSERAEQKRLQQELDQLRETLQRSAAAIRAERAKLQQTEARLAITAASAPIRLRIQERSSQAPYFYILANNRAWRVGPEKNGNDLVPSPDCTFTKDSPGADGSQAVHCRAVPERGVPICNPDGTVSAEFLQQFASVPADRVPMFKLDRASLKSFCTLREYLKKQNRLHGVTPELTDPENYSYLETTRKAEYYY